MNDKDNKIDMTERIQFRITKKDKQLFAAVCRNLGQQPSEILRRLISEYVQNYRDEQLVLRKRRDEKK